MDQEQWDTMWEILGLPEKEEEPFRLNRWGKLYLRYIQEKKHDFYEELLIWDRLKDHLTEKQEYALDRLYDLQVELKQANPFPKEKENDFMAYVQYNTMIGKQAEEFLIEELLS